MPVEIIAEAAQGYEGDSTLARLLARGAARAGADAVKFQLVYADEVVAPGHQHYALFRSLEMPLKVWEAVAQEARSGGIRFYLDVFGERSLQEAQALGADAVKIHSTDFFNASLVRLALKTMPRVFISIGGITAEELEAFLAQHQIRSTGQVCLLYGFQAEPTPIESNHLNRLGALRRRFPDYPFGFMDHTDAGCGEALTLPLLALPFGVCCLEKHITLDRPLRLEDYGSALSVQEFQMFVERLRRLEPSLGTDHLGLTEAEQTYRRKALKAVVASRPLKPGQVVTAEDVCLKRPASSGHSTHVPHLDEVIGRVVEVDVQPNHPVTKEMLR
ncbi:MAG: hypothetical protein A3I71_02305 [Omnitrophica WOR_2 bacterium RIFCSPLOWO2_02_FULL_63_16]|nr:MAG: hypothetical protein A3I71_02305 [Omnitrophica WOR_2 bacterium RIFCSPLOWO2_02_FULL_63_16]OGX50227.1 MAG: hypothetical protein A3G88_05445 [Omnitrophica WOR_2 bacterium RIFCSPLOWO2_12_FULL_63_16]